MSDQVLEPVILTKRENELVEVRVKATTPTDRLAGSITKFVLDGKIPVLLPVALPAQNQALKGAAKSKAYLAPVGVHLLWDISFTTLELWDEARGEMVPKTALKLKAVVFNV